jgi:hypothetical protein
MSPSELIATLLAKGSLDAEDVLRLRREIYGDGVIDRAEAEAVFELERSCNSKSPEWLAFFVDELTYYFVYKAQPRGYVSEENAQFLTDQIISDGRINGPTELELLIDIVSSAHSCPEELVVFVLDAVKESVLSPDTAAYDPDRAAGVIDAVDVEIIRRVINAGGGGGSYTVTRREANLLYDLNRATSQSVNAEGWRDLFVKGIASHLMFPLGSPDVPDVERILEYEAWRDQRPTFGRFLLALGSKLNLAGFKEGWSEIDAFGRPRDREEANLQESMARERIDEAEAEWLISRVAEDGSPDDNELALLAFIKKESPQIHPSLVDLIAKADV